MTACPPAPRVALATSTAPSGDEFPPVVNLRPADDENAYHVGVDLARVAAVLRRIAYDVDELARARAVADLDQAVIVGDRRAERRRRLAEPGLSYADFNRRYRERARSGVLRNRAPVPLTEADIWRAYQQVLAAADELGDEGVAADVGGGGVLQAGDHRGARRRGSRARGVSRNSREPRSRD